MKDCIPSPNVKGMYFSFFESIIIRYGLVLWGGSSRVKEIFILQKKVIRILSRSHFTDSCRPLCVDLRILTIYNFYILHLLILVHNTSESDFDARSDVHEYNTRSKSNIDIPFFRLEKAFKSYLYLGPKLYNMLPKEHKSLKINVFRTTVFDWLVKHPFYSIDEFVNFKTSNLFA